MIAIRRMLLVAACVALPACASSGGNAAAADHPATTVLVDNQAFLDMTIYVLQGGQRIRLGTANALTKTKFRIPVGIVNGITTVRFLADPIGSNRNPVSDQLTVNEGDEVELRIPPG
jgi:hypothetical protein